MLCHSSSGGFHAYSGSPLSRNFSYSMAPLSKASLSALGSQFSSPMTIKIGGLKLLLFSDKIFKASSAKEKNS
uniref:Uncharacterized protein n=1 Tax=Lotus japonicus TaxID=34305 RepID=I3S9V8_LOTJA|nr:unknown [Lotus japonicus]